jgi:hypothetical protein
MSWDDEPTRRIYRTQAGVIDWPTASECAQAICESRSTPAGHRMLSSLFAVLFARGAKLGVYDGVQAGRLLLRLHDSKLQASDIDDLWTILHKAYQ